MDAEINSQVGKTEQSMIAGKEKCKRKEHDERESEQPLRKVDKEIKDKEA